MRISNIYKKNIVHIFLAHLHSVTHKLVLEGARPRFFRMSSSGLKVGL